ncbi:uracil-DNA glycosylase family protein [Altibacter sp.]|uniref:uracil-DNA glycosylase family protein n=1 Tax=Altibacter sp. TaxID=2024823 RepID=UPI000C8D739C|nr:uracil-DNA glycosylase family protein [Altibacter sp.]MAP55725.1 IclR family transcriptional regulator [Altibacter sp.]
MQALLKDIRACEICKAHLPLGPRPVVTAHPEAKIAIIGQAPGKKVHETGIPWDDPSGKQLRHWLDVTSEVFYDPKQIALIPMGFCYPGKGRSGDLPPRPECAPQWHSVLLKQLPNLQLTLFVGMYSQKYYLSAKAASTLTETVRNYKEYLPTYLPLPHPSPRNRFWLSKNPWFNETVVPELQQRIKEIIS